MTLKDTLKPQHSGSVFADFKHMDAFLADGSLPKIHEQMGKVMDQIPVAERAGAIDFGACHGMLAIRAAKMGWTPVLGLELDAPSVTAFDTYLRQHVPNVTLQAGELDVRSPTFAQQARDWVGQGLTTWLARRVLSELFATTYRKEGAMDMGAIGEAVWKPAGHAFGEAARAAGVRHLVVQGRLYGPYKGRVAHPIYNTDREIEAIGPSWKVSYQFKDAVLMVPA